MNQSSVRLFQTAAHHCGYWHDRTASDLLLDPTDPLLPSLYPQFLALGFRRSGDHVYRPRCPECRACVPLRVPVATFTPDRAQRRTLIRNADLRIDIGTGLLDDERFDLYRRYVASRHAGGGMDGGSRESVAAFLLSRWGATRFIELREGERLLAVAVSDVTDDALSAVYTFFEPSLPERSLGTFAVLAQIEWARQTGREWLYLGFWIKGHRKMDYKRRFRPAEIMVNGRWRPLDADAEAAILT